VGGLTDSLATASGTGRVQIRPTGLIVGLARPRFQVKSAVWTAHVVPHGGNTMKRRHHAWAIAACFAWSNRRSDTTNRRPNRPCFDHLEPRCLLASIAEFPVPSGAGAGPDGMAAGTGASIWFTEFGADKVGTIDSVTHAISDFPIPTQNAQPFRIALGPDGNLWFTEFNVGQIGMINPATDKVTEYPLSNASAMPFGITAGPDHTVWFTEWSGNQVGSIDTRSGKITEYAIPTMNSVPEGITLGSDGNIWFTESQANQIAMFDTTSHKFVEHPLPTAGAQPYGITTGPGGNLYFTEYSGNQIGVYSVSGSSFLNSITIPTPGTEPTEITADPLGKLWFTQSKTNQVAMLDPSTGSIAEFAMPAAQSGPRGIASANDGSIWFAELNAARVATFAPSLQIVVTSSPPLDMQLGETFGVTIAVEFVSGGAVDTGYNGSVNLALLGAPSAGSLVGTTSVTAVNGIASFNGLSIIHPGIFNLQVKSGDVTPATIGPINVTGPTSSSPVNPRGVAPAPPVVLSERLVLAGKGKARSVVGVVLTFSSALDPTTARNASNYTVTQKTKRGRTKAVKAVRVHVQYKPASNTVKLTLSGRPHFAAGGQLVLNAANPNGIASSAGILLEGNMGGYSGANGAYTILPRGRGMAN
jgi:streptogramin lyase